MLHTQNEQITERTIIYNIGILGEVIKSTIKQLGRNHSHSSNSDIIQILYTIMLSADTENIRYKVKIPNEHLLSRCLHTICVTKRDDIYMIGGAGFNTQLCCTPRDSIWINRVEACWFAIRHLFVY